MCIGNGGMLTFLFSSSPALLFTDFVPLLEFFPLGAFYAYVLGVVFSNPPSTDPMLLADYSL
jgi:hypothetical protein